ncbi:MAG: MFS transporter [Myxococcales bacterium]|nr:MFS transporter [Myxococcales bacterium]
MLGIGTLAFAGSSIEGSVADWSSLYLVTVKNMDLGHASIGLGPFYCAMAAGRFAGWTIVANWGQRIVIIGGAIFAAIGILIALCAPQAILSALGFFFVGAGISNILPLLISSAGRLLCVLALQRHRFCCTEGTP